MLNILTIIDYIAANNTVMAKNLLLEEFPLAAKYVTKEDQKWILETGVYNYAGACRFYAGLAGEIEILESEEFRRYVGEYVKNNLNIFQ